MQWNEIVLSSQLDEIVTMSFDKPVLLFKHSTRCSISHMAKARLERETPPDGIEFYYLDLISYRSISNDLAL